jgi:hypothetical protein
MEGENKSEVVVRIITLDNTYPPERKSVDCGRNLKWAIMLLLKDIVKELSPI